VADLIPPPPINAPVNGLLSFFGLKNGGRNPQHLSEDLVPVIDLLDWYQANGAEAAASASTVINAVGFTSLGIVVPNGEWWFVQHFTVITGTLTAGQSLSVAPMWTDATPQAVMLGGYSPVLVAGDAGAVRADRNFWVPPGGIVGVHTTKLLLTPSVTGYLRFSRLRA